MGLTLVSTIDLRGVSGCPGMRLGDINGDGRMEIVVGRAGRSDHARLVHATGRRRGDRVRSQGQPALAIRHAEHFHIASSDIPIQVYDMDGDGKAEIFANMSTTEMTVLDGTGKVIRKIPLPTAGATTPSPSRTCEAPPGRRTSS